MQLHFDFTRDATRASIERQLRAYLTEDAWLGIQEQAAHAGIPLRHHHDIGEVNASIDALDAPESVKADMRSVYDILAHAEAHVHGCELEHTHFHEVGEGARLQNTLAICLAIAALQPEAITATPVQTGSGTIECAHGLMDIPAPATAAILAQGIPTCANLFEGELCTPTSAAMIAHFVQGFTEDPSAE